MYKNFDLKLLYFNSAFHESFFIDDIHRKECILYFDNMLFKNKLIEFIYLYVINKTIQHFFEDNAIGKAIKVIQTIFSCFVAIYICVKKD